MKYSIITELTESKLFISKNLLSKFNAKDVADITFLNFLALEILANEFQSAPDALEYAKKTFQYGGKYDSFRFGTTDLYILLHILTGKNNGDSVARLADQEESKLFLENIELNNQLLRRYMLAMSRNKRDPIFSRRFFLKLQQDLDITKSDYKNMRILITNWKKLNKYRKKLVITRMLQFFRARARRSELYPLIAKLAKDQKLEIKGVDDAETGKKGKLTASGRKREQSKKKPWWVTPTALAGGAVAGYNLTRNKKK